MNALLLTDEDIDAILDETPPGQVERTLNALLTDRDRQLVSLRARTVVHALA